MGQYTQVDPIGLAGGNPTLYGYVKDTNFQVDLYGLDWNYILRDVLGNVYYHGRASDNATLADITRRHSNTIGSDGARFGPTDVIERTTPVGTDPDIVRGIEQRGIQENELLGRGNENVRGNKINSISETNQQTRTGQHRLNEADKYLDGRKPSELNVKCPRR